MRSLLLVPFLFLFPSIAHASTTINVQSSATGGTATSTVYSNTQSTSYNTSNTQNSTHICTNVNGKETCYDSDKGGNVSVTNDGTNSSITVNGETKTSNTTTATPTPSQTEAKIRARIASEEAKIKAKIEEAKKKLEDKKKVLSAQSFDLRKFFQDLFNRIFHR